MPSPKPRPIELLAPARDAATAIAAIDHGADAVYIGAPSHGARAAATNSLDEIAQVVDYAHRFNARVYVTVNTIVYNSELKAVEAMIWELYRIGVDALIVQDLGILRLKLPPIALHASTQCDTRDPDKACFLQDIGFSQIVLARELSLSEIDAIHSKVSVPLETFVHGALCVSFSGDCHASWAIKGRSANRGECAQICRLPWKLIDADGREIPVAAGRHLLSLRDMNRSAHIAEMLQAGVSSFKIEGRLKDIAYVKNVVAAYRRLIDRAIDANPDLYGRSSLGEVSTTFTPNLSKSFNRGFTDYFLSGIPERMASMASPKSIGEDVGKVIFQSGNSLKVNSSTTLNNGDGLGFFGPDGEFHGFRLNRVDGATLFPASKVDIPAGTRLTRNRDKAWDDQLNGQTARREISIAITLRRCADWGVALDIQCQSISVSASLPIEYQSSKSPQEQRRRSVLAKLGDTPYMAVEITDTVGDMFIPASYLTSLRREAVTLLDRAIRLNHHFDYRAPEQPDVVAPQGESLSYHDNVANQKAKQLYTDHGVKSIQPALESQSSAVPAGTRVMTTRYCLRRELGACLKTPGAKKLPQPLFIVNGSTRLRIDCDCAKCQMTISTT